MADKTEKITSGDKVSDDSQVEDSSYRDPSGIDRKHMTADQLRHNINAKIANPLASLSHAELAAKGEEYVRLHNIGDDEDIRAFRLGAILAQDPNRWSGVEGLTAEEKATLEREISHKWSQPRLLYLVIILCSTCAAVQGMDETVVNGAQIFYSAQFGIGDKSSSRDSWLVGLVNSAPYVLELLTTFHQCH